MNGNHESRILRIERLETRSLLAGNLFAADDLTLDLFIDGADFSGSQQDVEVTQTQEVRSIGNNNSPNVQETTRPNPSITESDIVQNLQFDLAAQEAVALSPSQGQQAQQSSTTEVVNHPPISAVDAALSALTATAPTEAVGAEISIANETQPGLVTEQTLESSIVSGLETSQRQLATFTADLTTAIQEPSDGLIELAPADFDPSLDGFKNDSLLPWQIDTGLFPKIRSVVERASNHRAEFTDAAIASWLGRPGGMISLDQVRLPANPVIAGVNWFDVQLESSLQLHRSLELIASGKALPISDVAIDAIMASLNEIAESQTQPINIIHPIEVPKLVYPAIAILTAAAIAAKRKHRHPEPLNSVT
ncbi:hypothetical protein Q31b_32850 [Novipirellula aureliae]|uniref:Uncharacterized protein n=1 Tax=Novipirellula aureliae TaxID=2527966 RepID=A0A5C6DYK9_9BACT|nr:hypothetical protein [Novipirellula aureliae]TWU39969.1 hypothetical protein Q31b_32850 [Novipirellula aureliae]